MRCVFLTTERGAARAIGARCGVLAPGGGPAAGLLAEVTSLVLARRSRARAALGRRGCGARARGRADGLARDRLPPGARVPAAAAPRRRTPTRPRVDDFAGASRAYAAQQFKWFRKDADFAFVDVDARLLAAPPPAPPPPARGGGARRGAAPPPPDAPRSRRATRPPAAS